MLTNDGGNTGAGGRAAADTDQVTINVNTLLTGTPGPDSFNALPGQSRIDGLGRAADTITFNFALTDATVTYQGNKVIIDGPVGSHTVLTGLRDLRVHRRHRQQRLTPTGWSTTCSTIRAITMSGTRTSMPTLHYTLDGLAGGPRPERVLLDTSVYLAANPDVAASRRQPARRTSTRSAGPEGRVPSLAFDPRGVSRRQSGRGGGGHRSARHFLAFGARKAASRSRRAS